MYEGLTISMLQSLIADISSRINWFQEDIKCSIFIIQDFASREAKENNEDFKKRYKSRKIALVNTLRHTRKELKKAVALQKALKKEIAFRITNKQNFKRIQTEYDSTRKA